MNQFPNSITTFEASINKLDAYLAKQTQARPLHEVEADVMLMLREIGQAAMARFVEQSGTGDVGPVLVDAEGNKRRRHGVRSLTYRSLFGPVAIARAYYFAAQHGGVAPQDALLAVPERSYSYLLQRLVTRFSSTGAYDEARDSLELLLGARIPKAMAEAIVAENAAHVAAFQTALPAPLGEGAVLVIQMDGKGVPMICPKVEELPGPKMRAKAAKRRGKKKMSVVITLYSINPEAGCPPVPINRKVYAIIGTKRDAFAWLVAEAVKRGYGTKTTLFLSDGDPDLAALQGEFFPAARPCLDWIHLTEYLWDSAYVFHKEGSAEAQAWVKERHDRLLTDDAKTVLRGLRQSLTKGAARFTATQKETLETTIGYLDDNIERVPYGEFMLAGYPIGTGSVEGACRHLVADRMESTGMRWKPKGAQAVLHMRSIHLNGEMDEFTAFRIKREQRQLYAPKANKEAAA